MTAATELTLHVLGRLPLPSLLAVPAANEPGTPFDWPATARVWVAEPGEEALIASHLPEAAEDERRAARGR